MMAVSQPPVARPPLKTPHQLRGTMVPRRAMLSSSFALWVPVQYIFVLKTSCIGRKDTSTPSAPSVNRHRAGSDRQRCRNSAVSRMLLLAFAVWVIGSCWRSHCRCIGPVHRPTVRMLNFPVPTSMATLCRSVRVGSGRWRGSMPA